MNEKLKTMQEEVMKEAESIFKAAEKNADYVYRSASAGNITEKKGHYSAKLTNVVARDVMNYGLLNKKYYLAELSLPIRCMNDTLLRRFDDRKAGRELLEFPWDNAERIISLIHDAWKKSKTDALEPKVKFSLSEEELLSELTKRVLMMMRWAYVQDELESQKYDRLKAEAEVWNADNTEKLEGLTDKEKRTIETGNRLRSLFLKTLTGLPIGCSESKRCMDFIESVSLINQITFSGANGKLEELYKSGKLDKIDEFIKKA